MPLIQALHAQADDWRALEIARARKLLAGGEDVDAVLEALSRGLTQKMLHGTLAELRAADGDAAHPAGADACRGCSCAHGAARLRPTTSASDDRAAGVARDAARRVAPPRRPFASSPPAR